MKKITLSLIALILIGCSSIKISPEGEQVSFNTDKPYLEKNCKRLGKVEGYGSSEDEVRFDLRHNAKVEKNANTLRITTLKHFHQSTRMRNYIRRPELIRLRSTSQYEYVEGFSLRATGIAYLCPQTISAE